MQDPKLSARVTASGLASFAIPRAAIAALIDAHADAVTIGAYLTLACHTDESGKFSTGGLKSIRENLAINRVRAKKAIHTLCTMRGKATASAVTAPEVPSSHAPRSKSKRKIVQHMGPTIPLLYTREAWLKEKGGELPDGPHPRAKVLHILPTFDELSEERVWIGSGLVRGDAAIDKPLRQLKNGGDIAARFLLALYAGQDLDAWYGVPPHGFPWKYYQLAEMIDGRLRVLCASSPSPVGPSSLFKSIAPQHETNTQPCFDAIQALESTGLLYEAVVLLNRNSIPGKFKNGDAYGEIPLDAEILCDLGSPSPFGPIAAIEQGLGKEYMETLNQLAIAQGYGDAHIYLGALRKDYNGCDYLALILTGHPAMIAGLYRLRFRVTNAKNAFIEDATRRHLDANADALRKLNYIRATKKLEPVTCTL